MMHLARLAGLDDEADRGAQALADQVMVHAGGGEQRRDRRCGRADLAVGQDDDVVAVVHRLRRGAEPLERAPCPSAPFGGIGDVERLGRNGLSSMSPMARIFSRSSLVRIGWRTSSRLRLRGALEVEEVRPRPDEGDEAHHQLLADRVDRRVGDLREVLLEIGVEQLRLVRQRRDRRVVAHRADASWPVVAIGAIRSLRSSCV
jgi:hypothetical protein